MEHSQNLLGVQEVGSSNLPAPTNSKGFFESSQNAEFLNLPLTYTFPRGKVTFAR
jgi:hypothetical protein